MAINFDASEVRTFGLRAKAAAPRLGSTASAALRKTAFDIEADAKMLIEAYDAIDTGNMLNSVSSEVTGDDRLGVLTAEIGPTADYAVFVHEGTSVMAGRPFLGDAFDRRVPAYTAALAQLELGI